MMPIGANVLTYFYLSVLLPEVGLTVREGLKAQLLESRNQRSTPDDIHEACHPKYAARCSGMTQPA